MRGGVALLESLWGPVRRRAEVHVEALTEAEVGRDPAVAPDRGGIKTRLAEDLRGHSRLVRDGMLEAEDARACRIGRGPDRGHRRLRPARLAPHCGEADARVGQRFHHRTRRALVAVRAQAVGAQGVDEDEKHIDVVTSAQLGEGIIHGPPPGGLVHVRREGHTARSKR